jgi:hypothetical protein
MADLTEAEILALAKAAGVHISLQLVTAVGYSLNGLLETLGLIEVPMLNIEEHLETRLASLDLEGQIRRSTRGCFGGFNPFYAVLSHVSSRRAVFTHMP